MSVEPVAGAETRDELLHTHLFMTDPGRRPSSHINHWLWPAPAPAITDGNLGRVVDALAELPCYQIYAGGDPAALADAVSRLLDSGAEVHG